MMFVFNINVQPPQNDFFHQCCDVICISEVISMKTREAGSHRCVFFCCFFLRLRFDVTRLVLSNLKGRISPHVRHCTCSFLSAVLQNSDGFINSKCVSDIFWRWMVCRSKNIDFNSHENCGFLLSFSCSNESCLLKAFGQTPLSPIDIMRSYFGGLMRLIIKAIILQF